MKNERLEIRIDETLKERLMGAAEKVDRPAAELAREAILEKVETVESAKEKDELPVAP
jgi:predicted transcriptional regulator